MRPFLIAIPAVGIAFGFGLRVAGLEPPGPIGRGQSRPSRCCLRFWSRSGAACGGDFGLDIVAALSMSAALIFGEELAAAIVALMYAGGQYLETDAEGRAQHNMTTLLARAPRTTVRLRDGKLEEIGIDLVAVGDRLLVCQGDVVPVDGTVADGIACSTNRPAEQLIPASPGLLCSGIDSPVRDDLKVG